MERTVEPWLRGTLTEIEPVCRQVLHALELTREDAERWCTPLSSAQLHERPFGLPSVAFHLRHIVRSLDRLLTYAEGGELTPEQLAALSSEMHAGAEVTTEMHEFADGLRKAEARIRAISPGEFAELRHVGRARLPVPLAGLLVHCAEHTQRHSGQMVTTAKLMMAMATASVPMR